MAEKRYAILEKLRGGKRRFTVAYLTGATKGGGPIYHAVKGRLTYEEAVALLEDLQVGAAKNPRRRVTHRRRVRIAPRGRRAQKREADRRQRKARARRNPAVEFPQQGRGKSETIAWKEVKIAAQGIRSATKNQAIYNNADGLVDLADRMLSQVARGIHENPTLAVVGALNPPLGTAVELKYHRTAGKHPGWYSHKFTSRAKVLAMQDGSLRIVGR